MHNTSGVGPDCRELLEISQQRQVSETKMFCTINALDVWKTHVCKSTVAKMEQVKSKNRNRMADETLDASRRLANTGKPIDKGRWCQRSLDPGADPASKVRGGRVQKYLVVNSHNDFPTAREVKHTSQ